MSLLVRLVTRDGDILDLVVGTDQFTVAIISQGKNPGKSPCEKSCCWLSDCDMLRLRRIRPRVFCVPLTLNWTYIGLRADFAAFNLCAIH